MCVLTLSKASMAGCFLSTFLDFNCHSWSVQKRISFTSSGTLYDHIVWKTPWISLRISFRKVGSLHARFRTNIPENIDFYYWFELLLTLTSVYWIIAVRLKSSYICISVQNSTQSYFEISFWGTVICAFWMNASTNVATTNVLQISKGLFMFRTGNFDYEKFV